LASKKRLFSLFPVVESQQNKVLDTKGQFPTSKRSDLTPLVVSKLSWTPRDYVESISALADGVRTKANEAINWYVKAKKPKRVGATLVRVLTIL
jgi:hypothetical protein